MKYLKVFALLILASGCQITETITINTDGSGRIEVVQHRDESSYMQLAGDQYSKEEVYEDTTYVFKEYIDKYNETFLKYTPAEQQLFQQYANVNTHIKKSSFEKEFKTTFMLNFTALSEVPDLYKTENYADDIKYNYALTAENHYYKIGYSFNGKVFKRTVLVTSPELLQKTKEEFRNADYKYTSLKLMQTYTLLYHFPGKIKTVSNEKAHISADKKSITLEFQLSDCMQDPESTNLEVILE